MSENTTLKMKLSRKLTKCETGEENRGKDSGIYTKLAKQKEPVLTFPVILSFPANSPISDFSLTSAIIYQMKTKKV